MTQFDINSMLRRKKLKMRELSEQTGISVGLIGMWASFKALPSYDKMMQLIDAGITAEELFGKEKAKILLENSKQQNLDPNFQQGVKEMLEEILKEKFSK